MGSTTLNPLLVDTDVLIDHLRSGTTEIPYDSFSPLLCSTVTVAELYSGNAEEYEPIERLLASFEEVPLDGQIARIGGEIRRETELGIADSLIAATALSVGATVMSRNRRHFKRVDGLSLLQMDSAGVFEGPPDLSENADKYLRGSCDFDEGTRQETSDLDTD